LRDDVAHISIASHHAGQITSDIYRGHWWPCPSPERPHPPSIPLIRKQQPAHSWSLIGSRRPDAGQIPTRHAHFASARSRYSWIRQR
jgi:hypothetical protein